MTRIRWTTEAADQFEAIVNHIRDVAEILYIWHGAQDWR